MRALSRFWLGLDRQVMRVMLPSRSFETIGNYAIDAGIQDFRASDTANWFEPGGDERVLRIKAEFVVLEGLNPFHQSMVAFSKRDHGLWTRVRVVQENQPWSHCYCIVWLEEIINRYFRCSFQFLCFCQMDAHHSRDECRLA